MDRASEANRVVARQRSQYQSRALEAIDCVLTGLPAKERTAFWRDYPARDSALAAVRTSDGYRRLEREFAGQTEPR